MCENCGCPEVFHEGAYCTICHQYCETSTGFQDTKTNLGFEFRSWHTYRLLCADGVDRHLLDPPSVLTKAMYVARQYDERECGPHRLQRSVVVRADGPWTDYRADGPEYIREIAGAVDCPKCDAPIGEPCYNLSELRHRGRRVPTSWPHQERIEKMEAAELGASLQP